jgi:hypothetical protein
MEAFDASEAHYFASQVSVCVYVHFFMRVSTAPTGASPMRCHPPRRPP